MSIVPRAGRADALQVTTPVHLSKGNGQAPVLVVCDSPTQEAWRDGLPVSKEHLRTFLTSAKAAGLEEDTFLFVRLCPPVPFEDRKSKARTWAMVERHVPTLQAYIQRYQPTMVVTTGDLATRALAGKSVAITKARGQVHTSAIQAGGRAVRFMPMLSPGFVHRVPEHEPTFKSDFVTLKKLMEHGWNVEALTDSDTQYSWAHDLTEWLENPPPVLAVDTETTGLRHWADGEFPFLVQLCDRPGRTLCVPIHSQYWTKVFPDMPLSLMDRVVQQLQRILGDPRIRKIAHNMKFDHKMLDKAGMPVRGWLHDTQLMAFQVDENMMSKSLDECVRVFVPEMAGYADQFNMSVDKSRMMEVEPDVMLPYAGGDPDACFRLARRLRVALKKEPGQQNVYRRIMMPAIMMFGQVTEQYGVQVDDTRLEQFGEEVDAWLREEYRWLIRATPSAVRRACLAEKKDLSFTRPDFIREVLFGPNGFGLTPVVFTDSTRDLPDDRKVASTSAKDHLPYFVNHPEHGDYINRLIQFVKTMKLSTTYIGKRETGNGFWQYMSPDKRIYPNFALHKTNTGRTASSDPNGQNFPKRGRWAKSYLSTMVSDPGYVFAASDLSQIELRLIAWMAREPTMLRIYREGGDIHAMTAAAASDVAFEQFSRWKGDQTPLIEAGKDVPGSGDILRNLNPAKRREFTVNDFYALQRFRAKAVNFGFCYGAGAKTFRTYAKTDYGVDYTERESVVVRNRYFSTYTALEPWHESTRQFAHKHGFVQSLHGAIRHLPSIWSTDFTTVGSAERQAVNAPIQRFGSDLCLMGAMRFQSRVHPSIARVVLTIHDQVVLQVLQGYEQPVMAALCWAMENQPLQEWFGIESPIPMVSDAECGANLGTMQEMENVQAVKPTWWEGNDAEMVQAFAMGMPEYNITPDNAERLLLRRA
jgi:uracil-DNA glycosylase family 4